MQGLPDLAEIEELQRKIERWRPASAQFTQTHREDTIVWVGAGVDLSLGRSMLIRTWRGACFSVGTRPHAFDQT
jgi:hypothetical protein